MKKSSPTRVMDGLGLKPVRMGFVNMRDGSCRMGVGLGTDGVLPGGLYCATGLLPCREVRCKVSPSANLTNLTSWWGVLLVAVLLAAVSRSREREQAVSGQ